MNKYSSLIATIEIAKKNLTAKICHCVDGNNANNDLSVKKTDINVITHSIATLKNFAFWLTIYKITVLIMSHLRLEFF